MNNPILDVSHPCWTGVGMDFDHDWKYDGGDWDVGIPGGWVCQICDESDSQRDPPDSDD